VPFTYSVDKHISVGKLYFFVHIGFDVLIYSNFSVGRCSVV